MSSYGPQGGPYPGQPQDPWGDTPTDPYSTGYPDPLTEAGLGHRPAPGPAPASPGQPYAGSGNGSAGHGSAGHGAASYGAASYGAASYGAASYGAAGHGSAGHGAYGGRPGPAPGSITGEVWGPQQPPARPARTGLSGTTIAVIIVVVLLALAGAGAAAVFLTRGDGGDTATGGPSGGPSRPASAPPGSPAPSASTPNADAKVAKAGDCLVNRGTPQSPDMQKVTCAANTYQVLKRIDGTSDKSKCEGTPGLTDWYFFDHSDNKQDFVLCLKKR